MKIKGVIEIEGTRKKEDIELKAFLHRKNRNLQRGRSPLPLLFEDRRGARTHKDVRNEGASGDIYENKESDIKMTGASWQKMDPFCRNGRKSIGPRWKMRALRDRSGPVRNVIEMSGP